MSATSTSASPTLEWGWAGAALDGVESGDLHVVVAFPDGALLAVIDGLGHGPEAAHAASEAGSVLKAHATLPVGELIERCHEALRKTRGAVMSLAALDARSGRIEWFGVGNVEGLLFHTDALGRRTRETISMRGGVLGYRLPPLRVGTVPIYRGDLLVLASDGIRSEFSSEIEPEWPPQATADWVLARYGRASDDALVLVARYLGAPS